MKKFILTFFLIFSVISLCHAAGSCDLSYGQKTEYTAEIIWTCTGDATNGSIPDTTSGSYSSLFKKYPYAFRVWIENLSTDTDVTDNSDVYLYTTDTSKAKSSDLMNGQGVDQLDADTTNYIRLNNFDPIHGQVILDVNNQSEASAVYRIRLVVSK